MAYKKDFSLPLPKNRLSNIEQACQKLLTRMDAPMTALANTLERIALNLEQEQVFTEIIFDEYEYLLELANDVYIASLETHLETMENIRPSH